MEIMVTGGCDSVGPMLLVLKKVEVSLIPKSPTSTVFRYGRVRPNDL